MPHERQQERQLIEDYFELIDTFCQSLTQANRPVAIALAELPDMIRGYGHVKERNMDIAHAKKEDLMAQYEGRTLERLVS